MKKIVLLLMLMLPLMAEAQMKEGIYSILGYQVRINGNETLSEEPNNTKCFVGFKDSMVTIYMMNYPALSYRLSDEEKSESGIMYIATDPFTGHVTVVYTTDEGNGQHNLFIRRGESRDDIFILKFTAPF